jgi:predicted RND superfamily exporter protein
VRRALRFITDHPVWVLVAVFAATAFLGTKLVDPRSGEVHLSLDTSINRLLPEEDEDRAFYEQTRLVFGSDETILVTIVDDDVFTPENLERVLRLTESIQELAGVHHVVSLSTALNMRDVDGSLEIEPFLTDVPTDAAGIERLREEAFANPIYRGNLFSENSRAAVLLVYFLELTEPEFAEVDAKILQILDAERGEVQVRVTGVPHIKVATAEILISDLSRILPLLFGLVAVVALISFRTLRGALIPVVGIAIAILWTLGVLAWTGQSLNLITLIVPPLVLTIGFAYVIHVLTAHIDVLREHEGEPQDGTSSVYHALEHVALPVILTAATTVAGFLAMTLSPISAVKEVGLFSALGVLATAIVSLTFAPAMLQLLPTQKRVARQQRSLFDEVAERLAIFDQRNRKLILTIALVGSVISLASIFLIEVNNALISDFPKDHPVRADFEAINEELGGSNPFYIVIDTDYAGAFKEPVNLQLVKELQEWLAEQPEIGGSTSLVDYLMLINRGFHGNEAEYLRIPISKRLASQLLFFGASDELESYADSRYQKISILVRSKVIDSGALSELVSRIEDRLSELPPRLHATVTGNTVLVARTIDDIAQGQALSLGLAFLLIYAILAALFTSFRMGFIALLPNAIPVAVYFGAIGITGVELNSMNGLVACIVLGIAVDDTIHYLVRFNAEAHKLASATNGATAALVHVGRPVTYTTVALALGFLLFTSAEMNNWIEFGALGAFTLVVAWAIDVTFLPAMVSGLRIVTLWDVLSLDLGADPHLSIPIFRGLTERQAKVAALTARVVSFPAGHRLFSQGDKGQEMYVVVDGELRASIIRDGELVEFSRMRRGDVVGEVALFIGERTADVDIISEARVLRISPEGLKRIERRSPRIAAVLLHNLGEALAGRVVSSMDALSG